MPLEEALFIYDWLMCSEAAGYEIPEGLEVGTPVMTKFDDLAKFKYYKMEIPNE